MQGRAFLFSSVSRSKEWEVEDRKERACTPPRTCSQFLLAGISYGSLLLDSLLKPTTVLAAKRNKGGKTFRDNVMFPTLNGAATIQTGAV